MKNLENWILDLLADVIARFIVGIAAAVFVFFNAMSHMPLDLLREWKAILIVAGGVGAIAALFGLRKGPGLI